jgi:hypothetical protein
MHDMRERLVALFAPKLPYLLLDRDTPNREERSLLEALLPGRNAEAVWDELAHLWQMEAPLREAVIEVCKRPGDPYVHDNLDQAFAAALNNYPAQHDALAELAASSPELSQQAAAERVGLRRITARISSDWHERVLEGSMAVLMLILIVASLMAAWVLADNHELSVLRGFAIALLASLPGALYLRFLGSRAYSVWNEYTLNLHRLGMDEPQYLPRPPATSSYFLEWRLLGGDRMEGLSNIYKQKFQAYYGKGATNDYEVADNDKSAKASWFLPILLATAVFAAGWTALLGHSPIYSASSMTIRDVLGFGFAGAYLFILQMLMRRYFQSDLKPSAYIGAVVRVITVLIVVLVVHRVWLDGQSPGQEAAIAFIIGFFPLVGIQFLQRLATLALRYAVPSLKNAYPLSDLDGLNIWYEARLLEEGIEDMQNLSTANLVDVILHTRVPVGRLVDWVDQAVLYLHLELPKQQRGKRRKARAAEESTRDRLRRLGIRSATALEDAFRRDSAAWAIPERGYAELLKQDENHDLVEGLRWVLNTRRTNGVPDNPSVTQTILKALRDEPNLMHVRHWKFLWNPRRGEPPTHTSAQRDIHRESEPSSLKSRTRKPEKAMRPRSASAPSGNGKRRPPS